MKGKYIILEGPEGVGKTSVANSIFEILQNTLDYNFLKFKEPGATKIGQELRKTLLKVRNDPSNTPLPKTESLLYFADRIELFHKILIPHVMQGGIGIGVRSFYSTYAYQGFGRGIPLEKLRYIKRFAIGDVEPDLALLLLMDPEDGLKRKSDQEELNRFEYENIGFHKKVYNGYQYLWTDAVPNNKKGFWKIIDASQPFDIVVEETTNIVVDYLRTYA